MSLLQVRYYHRPEETHLGRQRHHGARELFLGTKAYNEPVQAALAQAWVTSPEGFAAAGADEESGNDVYVCEYDYDESWKRFRRRRYPGGGWRPREGWGRGAGGF